MSAVPASLDTDGVAPVARRLAAKCRAALALVRREWWPRLAYGIDRIGLAGFLGVALLTGTIVLQYSTRAPLLTETTQMAAVIDALPPAPPGRLHAPAPASVVAALPTRKELPGLLKQVVERADAAGLVLTSGKYETAITRTGGVVRYHVTLPVNGRYPQVRTFVGGILRDMPQAALSGLSLQRRAVGDPNVTATVRLTLFLRDVP